MEIFDESAPRMRDRRHFARVHFAQREA